MITVVVPAHNEEETIGETVDNIKKYNKNIEIIVVNNFSNDKTKEIAIKKGVKVIDETKKGKGFAMIAGANFAQNKIIVFIDGDNTYPANYIKRLTIPIIKKNADIVFGSRFLGKKIQISKYKKIGNKFFSYIASLKYKKTSDLLTGMIAIKKDIFLDFNLQSGGFEVETEIFIKATKKKLKTKEISIPYRERKNSNLSPTKDGLLILKTLFFCKY